MGKVIKANAEPGLAYAEFDNGSAITDFWIEAEIGFFQAALDFWDSDGDAVDVIMPITAALGSARPCGVQTTGGGGCEWSPEDVSVIVTGDEYHTVKYHRNGTNIDIYVDGDLIRSQTTGAAAVQFFRFGLTGVGNVDDQSYFKSVKIGTTEGDSDIFEWNGLDLLQFAVTGDVSVVDDPWPPPPPPRVRVFADLPVRVFVTTKESRTVTILDKRATDKQFLFPLNAPAYHTGQVASDDPEVNLPFPDADSPANLTNNRRLVFALQRWKGYDPPYQPIFAGIVTSVEDQGTDAPTTRYTASDPWQYMMSRPYRHPDTGALLSEDFTFPDDTPGSYIAMIGLVNTFAVDGETHIDTDGTAFPLVEETDGLTGFTVNAGQSLGEVWIALCETGTIDIHLPPIYDPIDRPGKCCEFQTVRQALGVAAGPVRFNAVMAWDKPGNSLMGVNRLVDGTRLANSMNYFAGDGVPAPVETDAASATANGVYWAQQFFPGTTDVNLVSLLALAEMLIRRNGARSISLDPAPERVEVPLRDYGPGDYLPVWASRNLREPLGVDYDAYDPDNPGACGYQRIYAIPLTVDDNGVVRVPGILTSKEN